MNSSSLSEQEVIEQTANNRNAGYLTLLWAIFRMNLLLTFRYRVNFIAQLIGMYLFFAMIFFGGQAAVGGANTLGGTLDALIVGWFLLTMAQDAYSSLSAEVTQESRWGTLEQLFMSPYGFGLILSAKIFANLAISLLAGLFMLVLMLLTTGRTLILDVITIAPIVVLTLLSVVGLGYMFAGLALIYKQIDNISQLMQFGIIGLIAAPAADMVILMGLPLVQGSAMLQDTMREGVRLWEFSPFELGVLIAVAVIYWGIGYFIFTFCLHVARRRGVMSHY